MGRPKGYRRPLEETPDGILFFKLFLKPFLSELTLGDEQTNAVEGIEAFFSATTRKVMYVKASESFTIPGPMWASLEQPTRLVPGTGRRYMAKGQYGVLRMDKTMPERSEIEFEEQVFVLTRAHLSYILEKLTVVS